MGAIRCQLININQIRKEASPHEGREQAFECLAMTGRTRAAEAAGISVCTDTNGSNDSTKPTERLVGRTSSPMRRAAL